MWSNQESIRTGPYRAHTGIRPLQFGGILLQIGEWVKTSQILHRIVAGMSHNYPGLPNRSKTYSIARRNSNPKRRISPTVSWRKTLAAIGGVSLGIRLGEAGDGAGMVKCTI